MPSGGWTGPGLDNGGVCGESLLLPTGGSMPVHSGPGVGKPPMGGVGEPCEAAGPPGWFSISINT